MFLKSILVLTLAILGNSASSEQKIIVKCGTGFKGDECPEGSRCYKMYGSLGFCVLVEEEDDDDCLE